MSVTRESPTAAQTGASASEAFKESHAHGEQLSVATERVATVVTSILDGIKTALRDHNVSYPEFQAAKAWLISVGETGEFPLLLDVFLEHVIEEVAAQSHQGTKGTILGPFYLPGQIRLPSPASLPRRPNEPGDTLILRGQVRDLAGSGLANAELDVWQSDAEGYYAGFAPHIPAGNLRGVVETDAEGRFEINTVMPAPYQIPHDGPTGQLLDAAGWTAWRPAHLHLYVRAKGHRTITSQLYFPGDEWLDTDVASAVKPELILNPVRDGSGVTVATYDFVLEPA